ncbi:TPA: hypothetical protein SMO73_002299 [Proteus mirabilis]|nr:hypothetical protein [Proteus mirabilis]
MSCQSIKQVVKAMCEATAGGREAMAGALGLSLTSFNNKLYEKNGCRSFDLNELLAMQDISKTVLFAEFVARESNRLLVDRVNPAELDTTELFTLRSNVDEMQGHLALLMKNSLADGVIDNEEEQKIKMMLDGLISQIHTFMNVFVLLHQKRN